MRQEMGRIGVEGHMAGMNKTLENTPRVKDQKKLCLFTLAKGISSYLDIHLNDPTPSRPPPPPSHRWGGELCRGIYVTAAKLQWDKLFHAARLPDSIHNL